MAIIIEWTEEKKENVLKLIENYVLKHEITSSEAVYQRDEPNIEAVDLVSDIIEVTDPEDETLR
jgi:hypothetical protein